MVAVAPAQAEANIRAKVVRTKYGVPHIKANNIKSLAAGYAYAFAEDNLCTIANEYVTVNAERSRYFGPDEDWYFSGNGTTYENIDADVYFGWVKEQGIVEDLMKEPPPIGPVRGVKRGVAGYVKGYNSYLKKTGVDNLPDPRCRGADWVRPITKVDVYRRFFQLGILASSGAAITGIATAEPVGAAKAAEQQATQDEMLEDGSALSKLQPQIGSNAYAFGKEATENGRGLVYGNPHFPWDGSERLYQTHLKIPGKVDVAGGSLYGVPLVLIGHTRGLAWSHTVATAWRFTPYRLQLGADPHTYLVDGELKDMEETEVTVKALADGGELQDVTRSIYSTEYGPMITSLVGIPLPWAPGSGFAIADVNATNFRYLNHFLANNKAQSVREYDKVQRRFQGIPWVNSVAADSKGEAYYSMQGAIPYVNDEHSTECNVGLPVFEILGLPIMDGSRSACAWESSDDAVAPGTFPPDEVPTLFRDDYVHNGNDSHWLSNPEEPLTGYDRIIGIEEAERTYRTRIGLIQIEDRLNGTDGLPGDKFDQRSLEKVALGNRQYLGELWRDDLVTLCELAPGGLLVGSGGPVDVSGACQPLADWDLRDNLNSNGAVLFRRFATRVLDTFQCLPTGLQGQTCPGSELLMSQPLFSASDPVHTPGGGLNIANPLVERRPRRRRHRPAGRRHPARLPLLGVQSETRGGEAIPIHGGPGTLGVFNAIAAPWQPTEGGYPDIPHGGSFIMATEFTGDRCPVDADTFVTYGQSENQSSPHSSDYTKAFSEKNWNDAPFCAPDVKQAALDTYRVRIGKHR